MKKAKLFLCLALLCAFFCVPCTASFVSKAYSSNLIFSNVTSKSITIDFNATMAEIRKECVNGVCNDYTVKLRIVNIKNQYDCLLKTVTVPGDSATYTFSDLNSGRQYEVEFNYTCEGTKYTISGCRAGRITTRRSDKGYTMNHIGSTDTALAISYQDAYNKFLSDCQSRKWTGIYGQQPYFGIAAEGKSTNTKQALSKAKKDALQGNYKYCYNKKMILKGLKPNTCYAVFMVLPYTYKNEYGVSQSGDEYFELTGIKTDSQGAYSSDDVGDTSNAKCTKNNNLDQAYSNLSIVTNNSVCRKYADYDVTTGSDSITLDWSKYSSVTKPGGGKNSFLVTCVEDTAYDAFADMDKNGYYNNFGPNMRKAVKQAAKATNKNTVSKGKTSYTFKNLKPGTRYCVVLKCGCNASSYKTNTCYILKKIYTSGGNVIDEKKYLNENVSAGYMFDVSSKREGNTALLDWTDARNKFMSLDVFKKIPVREYSNCTTYLHYKEIPNGADNRAVDKIYYTLYNGEAYGISLPSTKFRVYGLDPSKKYVFCIRLSFDYMANGEKHSLYENFYADETGMNYRKKEKLGLTKSNPAPVPKIIVPTDDDTKEDSKDDGYSYNQAKSPVANTTPAGKSGSPEAVNTPAHLILIGKKEDNKAHIYVDKNRLKASELKKSKKFVTIKVENSEGKISIKNISSAKLKNNVKFKINGRKISVKFKKGSPKGTYKFKVTVKAKGNIKKTVQTVKVVVK
ncbi:fibronectin type III domain-containing protein [Butyrivibrio sp. AE3004]|uniref:fibronectin type III domain-containing protein n=1 Tax=Butyrivibrio sp. AE3004 TaxID=1506994 RepID=UPI000494C1FB|nr:fibronectin type III domain-containing protein [Butyrivibrio sp. AE3004]